MAAAPLLLTWRAAPEPAAPRVAKRAGEAVFDQSEIVVDLRDDATAADVARLDRETGLDLEENSPESHAARLMRAHVAPEKQAAELAELRADPAVEAAEPEALYGLDPEEPTRVPAPTVTSAP